MFANRGFSELERISHAVGNRPEYVQGGGGNTSVKLDNIVLDTVSSAGLMAVKASGYKLNQITQRDGFVIVDYRNLREYYNNIDFKSGIDYEKDSSEFTKNNIVKIEDLKDLRPSVEAGFHSILKKYVIHTHPVYANILCCSEKGEELVKRVFPKEEWNILWVPYVNPGFYLTIEIKEGIEKCLAKGSFPEIILMENHGLIVTSDNPEDCINLHTKVNEQVKEFFGISEHYPGIKIAKFDDEKHISGTEYLREFFKGSYLDEDFFWKYVLYPDQLVYLNDSVSLSSDNNKLNINTKTGELLYNTNYNEALVIEETLLAYIYVIKSIERYDLTVKSMTKKQIDFISNWESEKYRKSIAKK